LVHDTGSLKLLVDNQGAEQVVLGLDDPYPLGEMDSEPQSSYPGKILDLAIERDVINREEYDAMWGANTIRWLCGDDEDAQQALLQRIRGADSDNGADG
jgi:aminocarboxymuconate-semialdehyde decarboxylase